MTAVDERGMTRFFEESEPPEGVKVELLRGVVMMTAAPDLVHNLIVLLTERQFPLERWYPFQTQDIDIVGEASEPIPDLVAVTPDCLPESGTIPSRLVTMVVEVVSNPVSTRTI